MPTNTHTSHHQHFAQYAQGNNTVGNYGYSQNAYGGHQVANSGYIPNQRPVSSGMYGGYQQSGSYQTGGGHPYTSQRY
jgi:hypothetical protein